MESADAPVARRNWEADPVDLYDMPAPTVPTWLMVRYAIHEHRNDRRRPVML